MRTELSLDGAWELAGFEPGRGDWPQAAAPYPVAAPVPGEVHPALHQAGIIPDPYYGTNADEVQWVEGKEWWYRRSFTLPPGFLRTRTWLEFDGLDTYAEAVLNGESVGTSANMFTPHRFDVTGKVREGEENVLEVRFRPVMQVLSEMDLSRYRARYDQRRVGVRKMQSSFGWDWRPRFLGAGIWRSARVVSCDGLSFGDLRLTPEVTESRGEVWMSLGVTNDRREVAEAVVRITVAREEARETIELHETISAAGERVEGLVTVPAPELWWPNGLGAQPLYQATFELFVGGELVDRRAQRFAFRTVELRERDADGHPAFTIAVNGMPVFAKGANRIPSDCFPSTVTEDQQREALLLIREANMNMVRVWGGGAYEAPEFYDLCDELGVMVWQDFMFSLAEYPETEEFVAVVAREVEQAVHALRHHPCIVMWCGNNECELDVEPGSAWQGKKIFHDIIPALVQDLDGTRPYWPSSPYGGPTAKGGDAGDFHGEPWFHVAAGDPQQWREWIAKEQGLFMSETPTQGSPEVETLRRFLPEDARFPPRGEVWELHAGNNEHRQGRLGATSLGLLNRNIANLIGEPRRLEEFARLSGVLQGHFLKTQLDYYRRRKFGIAGALVWMLCDAWPAVDFSLIDWYLRPKPVYYYVKRAFAHLALVIDGEGDKVAAWVVNDLRVPAEVEVRLGIVALEDREASFDTITVTVPANSVAQAWRGPRPPHPDREAVVGEVRWHGDTVSRTYYYDLLLKEMRFARPQLTWSGRPEEDGWRVRVSSDLYAPAVALFGLPDRARPEDNYFHLLPGETREIVVRNITDEEAGRVRVESAFPV